jgi:hypothetical protein
VPARSFAATVSRQTCDVGSTDRNTSQKWPSVQIRSSDDYFEREIVISREHSPGTSLRDRFSTVIDIHLHFDLFVIAKVEAGGAQRHSSVAKAQRANQTHAHMHMEALQSSSGKLHRSLLFQRSRCQ